MDPTCCSRSLSLSFSGSSLNRRFTFLSSSIKLHLKMNTIRTQNMSIRVHECIHHAGWVCVCSSRNFSETVHRLSAISFKFSRGHTSAFKYFQRWLTQRYLIAILHGKKKKKWDGSTHTVSRRFTSLCLLIDMTFTFKCPSPLILILTVPPYTTATVFSVLFTWPCRPSSQQSRPECRRRPPPAPRTGSQSFARNKKTAAADAHKKSLFCGASMLRYSSTVEGIQKQHQHHHRQQKI